MSNIKNDEKDKFGRHFTDALSQAEIILKDTFDILKRDRLVVNSAGVETLTNRLAISLSDILNNIYSKIVPFDFDGFDSKQPSRAKKSYCSILKLLLSGSINANTIQSSPVEVRNRFEATLFETGHNSWKCINSNYQIIPPKDTAVFNIYNYLENKLKVEQELNCKEIFSELCMPPYGLNDYVVVYMLAVFCSNLSYCIRPMIKGVTYSVTKWKDIIIGDSKVDIIALKNTIFMLVDANEVVDRYLRLFKKVESNDDITKVDGYISEFKELLISEEVPTELEAQHKLCEYKLNEGKKILLAWNRNIDDISEKFAIAEENNDVYQVLTAIQMVQDPNAYGMLNDKYKISDVFKEQLRNINTSLKEFVSPRLVPWIKEQRCNSIESMSQYRKHIKRIVMLLESLDYFDEAKIADKHGENELQSHEDIRDRQELKTNCGKFMSEKNVTKFIAYTTLLDWNKQGIVLLESIEKHKYFLGLEAETLKDKIGHRVNEIIIAHQKIKADMDDIWNDIYDLTDLDAVEAMIERIDYICKKGISTSDRDDFVTLYKVLGGFIDDVKELSLLRLDRIVFEERFTELYAKYSDEKLEIDVLNIFDAISNETRNNMDVKEREWIKTFITEFSNNLSRPKVLDWIDKTINLPAYISSDTREKYSQVKHLADKFLSDANIDDVLHHFRKLNNKERAVCIKRLLEFKE